MEITLTAWEGMPHVFQSFLGQFRASEQPVAAIADFLRHRLDASTDEAAPPTSLQGP